MAVPAILCRRVQSWMFKTDIRRQIRNQHHATPPVLPFGSWGPLNRFFDPVKSPSTGWPAGCMAEAFLSLFFVFDVLLLREAECL